MAKPTKRPVYAKIAEGTEENLKVQRERAIREENAKIRKESKITGDIQTLRDQFGNIVLYEDPDDPTKNLESYTQYLSFVVDEPVYDYDEAIKAIDVDIRELRPKTDAELINELFSLYNQLKDTIPIFGNFRSHEYLITESSDISGNRLIDPSEYSNISSSLSMTREQLEGTIQALQTLTINSEAILAENESLRSQVNTLLSIISSLQANPNESIDVGSLPETIFDSSSSFGPPAGFWDDFINLFSGGAGSGLTAGDTSGLPSGGSGVVGTGNRRTSGTTGNRGGDPRPTGGDGGDTP